MPLATLAAAFASAPDLPPPPPPPSDNDLFEKLQWQMPRSVPTSTGASALQRMLLGQHCEEVVSTSVCPDQFFAFLSVEPSVVLFPDRRTGLQYSPGFRWVATFPECASYLPTQHGPERNGFSVLASTGTNTRGHLEAGAVLLRFENTTSADHGWRSLAGKQQCTVQCLLRDLRTRAIRVRTMHVPCPSDTSERALAPGKAGCASEGEATMLLHPAGIRVADPDSALEGEVCSWARPERPHLPDGWEAEQGAAAAAAAAAMTTTRWS